MFPKDWKIEYQHKIQDPRSALKNIKPGERIFIGSGCAVPSLLIKSLEKVGKRLADTEIMHNVIQDNRYHGVLLDGSHRVYMENNTIFENGEVSPRCGIYSIYSDFCEVNNCTIFDNIGNFIFYYGPSKTFTNCSFTHSSFTNQKWIVLSSS